MIQDQDDLGAEVFLLHNIELLDTQSPVTLFFVVTPLPRAFGSFVGSRATTLAKVGLLGLVSLLSLHHQIV